MLTYADNVMLRCPSAANTLSHLKKSTLFTETNTLSSEGNTPFSGTNTPFFHGQISFRLEATCFYLGKMPSVNEMCVLFVSPLATRFCFKQSDRGIYGAKYGMDYL